MTVTINLDRVWRFAVFDLDLTLVTFLDRLATSRAVTYILDAPAVATCDVPSDNPEVNIPYSGDPLVSYASRILYGFRREPTGSSAVWVPRFAGIIQQIEDEAASDEPVSHITAYDPWQWLNSVPVVKDDGSLLGPMGWDISGVAGNTLALELLANGMAALLLPPGVPRTFEPIEITSGVIETTDPVDIHLEQGVSVGEAWTQLTDGGWLDIVLTPIYDPVGYPGKIAVLNIYNLAGADRDNAIFGWDKAPHSLSGFSSLYDGTQLANVVQYYAQGLAVTQERNAPSQAKYGSYWQQQNYTGQNQASSADVALLAFTQLRLRKQGKRTITIEPEPERSPEPFIDYFLGDRVPIWAGRLTAGGGVSTREALTPGTPASGHWTDPQRIYQIPLNIADDETETVTQMLVSPD